MIRAKFWASVLTIAGAAFVAIGACTPAGEPPTGPPVPVVLGNRYVLMSASGPSLPALVEDSIGQPVRIYADTIYFSSDSTYIEAGRIGRFLGFPTENITNFRSAARRYTKVNENEILLPVLLGGRGRVMLYSAEGFGIEMRKNGAPDNSVGSYWYFSRRN